MMLDISGSMQDSDVPNCYTTSGLGKPPINASGGATVYYLKQKDGTIIKSFKRLDEDGNPLIQNGKEVVVDTSQGISVPFQGCNNKPARRIDLLKKAMIDLVNVEGSLPDVKLGLGTFPTTMNQFTGRMVIPAKTADA